MNNKISHRGPDGEGFFIDKINDTTIALGHKRLAIIDLTDNASQPMYNDNKDYSIIFNGEIYNYLELKEELKQYNFSFRTTSDTEVLLKSYIKWGEKCLDKLNGMFSFVVYDKKEKIIFGARDRFGIKPLYYQLKNNDIKIASEIKQFTVFDDFSATGNLSSIKKFIYNRHIDYNNNTFFYGISQLAGGEFFKFDLNNFKFIKKRWYNIFQKKYNKKNTDSNNFFYNLFKRSVEIRLRSDVEVGFCLSGGIDSSSIVSMANVINGNNTLQTFHSTFKDKKYNEEKYAQAVINKKNIKLTFTHPEEKDFFKKIEEIIYHSDEPIWSTSVYSQYKVFLEAHNSKIKVMLDGQGGDEIFAGYTSLFYDYYINNLLTYNKSEIFLEFFKSAYKKRIIKCVLNKIFNKKVNKINSIREKSIELIQYHLPALLHYEDRMSMMHSIETRLPFLDYNLVEFGLNLPEREKIEWAVGKKIIRQSLREIVPDKVLNRKDKLGFATPQREWIINNKSLFKEALIELSKTNIMANDEFEDIKNNLNINSFDDGKMIRIYTTFKWIQIFKIKRFKNEKTIS